MSRRSRTPCPCRRRRHRRRKRQHSEISSGSCESGSCAARGKQHCRKSRGIVLASNSRHRPRRQSSSPYQRGDAASPPRSVARRSYSGSYSVEPIRWEPGLRLGRDNRYVFDRQLGKGAFSRVIGCRDAVSRRFVAVKVAKDNARQRRHAESEASILKDLNGRGGAEKGCPRLLDDFVFADRHYCLVFEPLAMSLADLIRHSSDQGLLLLDIKEIAQQLLTCLCFVHSTGLAHTDIKCQNVMLRKGDFDLIPHPRAPAPWQAPQLHHPFEVVLIDFGCAVCPENHKRGRVGARQIRAPEVILGLTWDTLADLWSLGCVLGALYTGSRMFQVHDDMEHLATIEHLLSTKIPASMSSRVPERILEKGVAFEPDGRLAWPACAAGADAVERVKSLQRLKDRVLRRHRDFLDLMQGLMAIQATSRLSAEAALRMPFLKRTIDG